MTALHQIVLGIHLVSAMFFIGGSLFVWLVLIPASYRLTREETPPAQRARSEGTGSAYDAEAAARGEARRTEIVGQIAKSFGKIVGPTVLVLLASGIYNATWYLNTSILQVA